MHDRIHDIELSTMDANTAIEVKYFLLPILSCQAYALDQLYFTPSNTLQYWELGPYPKPSANQ